MQTSDKGRRFLAAQEGEVLEVYLDSADLPTLGVGHLLTPDERRKWPVGTKISQELSDAYLAADLARFERCVAQAIGNAPTSQNQFDAMVSLAFNVGEDGFRRSSVLRHHKLKNYQAAADAFALWNRAGGKVSKGLTNRRKREAALYLAQ
jgi:lysozyme